MAKILITQNGIVDDAVGNGFIVEKNAGTFGVSPFALHTDALSSNVAVTQGGVYTLGGTGARTVTMPAASSHPGSIFVFRSTTAQAHVLTASNETNGFRAFTALTAVSGSVGTTLIGSAVTFPANIGASVVIICDGRNYLVTGGTTGSFAFSGT